jgi:hypothetical protein
MVQHGLSKSESAWIFVAKKPECALEFNVSALTTGGYLTDAKGLTAEANDFQCFGNLSGSMALLNQVGASVSSGNPAKALEKEGFDDMALVREIRKRLFVQYQPVLVWRRIMKNQMSHAMRL